MVRGSCTNSIMYHSNPNKIQHRQHDSNIMRQHQHNARTQQWERHQHHARATASTARHQHHLHDAQTSVIVHKPHASCTNTSTKVEAPLSTPCTNTSTTHKIQRRHQARHQHHLHDAQTSALAPNSRQQRQYPRVAGGGGGAGGAAQFSRGGERRRVGLGLTLDITWPSKI